MGIKVRQGDRWARRGRDQGRGRGRDRYRGIRISDDESVGGDEGKHTDKLWADGQCEGWEEGVSAG